MKKYCFYISAIMVCIAGIVACKKAVPAYEQLTDSKDGALIFTAKANSGIQKLTTFPYDQETRSIKFNAGFGAVGLPANPIDVSFTEDIVAFDSINVARVNDGLEPYERFPKEAYTIDKLKLTVPSGELYSDFSTLTYTTKGFNSNKSYLLALTISNAGEYNVSPSAKSILFVVDKLQENPANTSGWLAQASSEEPGQGTGLASAVLDGNLSTIWHSRYKPAPAEKYPHWLSFDMQKELYVTKVSIATRQNNLKGMTKFKLEGSKDGQTWFDLIGEQNFNPANIAYQTYPVPPQFIKNIKLSMLEGMQDPTFLSEFVVYAY